VEARDRMSVNHVIASIVYEVADGEMGRTTRSVWLKNALHTVSHNAYMSREQGVRKRAWMRKCTQLLQPQKTTSSSTHRRSCRDDLQSSSQWAFEKHTRTRVRTCCLRVLTTDTEPPEVTETTVGTDLLETLEVVTHLRVDTVGENLRRLAVNDVLLPVQEPRRDLELRRVLDDGDDTLQLIRVELAGTGEGQGSQ
jgi:hypothetical protein